MARIYVAKIGVFSIEYKGANTNLLEKGYRYTAIIIDGVGETTIETQVHLLNQEHEKITYEGVIGFSQDWDIICEVKFEKPWLPIISV